MCRSVTHLEPSSKLMYIGAGSNPESDEEWMDVDAEAEDEELQPESAGVNGEDTDDDIVRRMGVKLRKRRKKKNSALKTGSVMMTSLKTTMTACKIMPSAHRDFHIFFSFSPRHRSSVTV